MYVFAVAAVSRVIVLVATSISVKVGHLPVTAFESQPNVVALILCSLAIVGGGIFRGDGGNGIFIASLAILDVLAFAGFHVALLNLLKMDREPLKSNASKRTFVAMLVYLAAKSTVDIYSFTICYFSHEVVFFVCVSAQGICAMCMHFLMYNTYTYHRDVLGGMQDEDEGCEIMVENYLDRRDLVGDASFKDTRVLSFPNMPTRNAIKIVFNGNGTCICHDKETLSHDQKYMLKNKRNGHDVDEDNKRSLEDRSSPMSKIEYERLKRTYQSHPDRDFRATLFTSCISPSLASVQRARATRGILTKFIRRLTLRFHDDEETALIRARVVNVDDLWLFKARATFIMCIERCVQGFPTLWSPQEDFFTQCEGMVNKNAFNCDVDFRFYLLEAQRSGRADLQPYLLEDLCVKDQTLDENGATRSTLVIYVPLKVLALTKQEAEAAKAHDTDAEIWRDTSEDEAFRMKSWGVSKIGNVNPVKAGRVRRSRSCALASGEVAFFIS